MSKETEQKSINGSISKVGCEGTLKELLEVLKGYDVFTARMYLKTTEEYLDRVSIIN